MHKKECCKECKYFNEFKNDGVFVDADEGGECRRYPPGLTENVFVRLNDWCGEFRKVGTNKLSVVP